MSVCQVNKRRSESRLKGKKRQDRASVDCREQIQLPKRTPHLPTPPLSLLIHSITPTPALSLLFSRSLPSLHDHAFGPADLLCLSCPPFGPSPFALSTLPSLPPALSPCSSPDLSTQGTRPSAAPGASRLANTCEHWLEKN